MVQFRDMKQCPKIREMMSCHGEGASLSAKACSQVGRHSEEVTDVRLVLPRENRRLAGHRLGPEVPIF